MGLVVLGVGVGLGSSSRLTYHEAFVAQAAREMLASRSLLVPTIDGRPWLEKPPLPFWLVAGSGWILGEVNAFSSRLSSAIAAVAVALGVASLASRRFGSRVGWLAGLVQATTSWLVIRGRLAEADILLAALVTWTFVLFDRIRQGSPDSEDPTFRIPSPHVAWQACSGESQGEGNVQTSLRTLMAKTTRVHSKAPSPWLIPSFFVLLASLSLVKGIGFGAILVMSAVVSVLAWDRDRRTFRALIRPTCWLSTAVITFTWPALVAARLPQALSLWSLHVADRLASHPEHFIGGPWWSYVPAVLGQTLPWTPLALLGASFSFRRARTPSGRFGVDRLLWTWAVVPVLVLSAATVKNGHYAIHALPPWSVWAALGLVRLEERLRGRGWKARAIERAMITVLVALAAGCGLGHVVLGPRHDPRGREWDQCSEMARLVGLDVPLVFLYEDWDRKPYPTPFGPIPHDWAVRLFYLGRPAVWRQGIDELIAHPPNSHDGRYALVGRDRDVPALLEVGDVDVIRRFSSDRFDRAFTLFRISPR